MVDLNSLRYGLVWAATLGALFSGPNPGGAIETRASPSEALKFGLAIWRKPGAIDGGAACATCHSPDGIELAAYAFDDADLIRRAQPHLGESDARRLVDYVHALRAKYSFHKLRDPINDRPLQPGGQVLAGEDPAARDFAFGLELKGLLPHLCEGEIQTTREAKAAEAELLRVKPATLRIGIPLNRLSEDVAHGNEHASIAQWFPEVPPRIEKKDLESWYTAEDKYLAKPSASELHQLLLLQTKVINVNRLPGVSALSDMKFRGLLVLQDRIRHGTDGLAENLSSDVAAYGDYNPIWEVGEEARQVMDRDPKGLGMDPVTEAKKTTGPPMRDQLHALRISWFWAGWLSDQGLFKTSHDDKTRLGMWFSESVSKDGPYPIHNVYANARRQAVVSNDISSWGEPVERRRRIWDFAGLRSFQFYLKDLPKEPEYRDLYVTFTANCFRMNLLLLLDDIRRTHEVWMKPNTRANTLELISFMNTYQPATTDRNNRLKNQIFELVDTARERF